MNILDIDPNRAQRVAMLAAHYAAIGLSERHQYAVRPTKAVIVNGVRYASSHEAAKAIGCCESTIREVCRGERKTKLFTAEWAKKL